MRTIVFVGVMVILLSVGEFPAARAAPRGRPAPVNFVANPGFELVQQWKPVGWSIGKDKGFSLSDKAHTGRCCVALASPNGEWPSIEQEVKVLPGRTYLLSFWFRSEGDGGGDLSVQLNGEKWSAGFRASPTKEWKQYCYLVTPKVPSFKLNLSNYHRKGMTFFIDDVSIDPSLSSLVELSAPPSETSPLANNTPTFQWRPSMDKKYLSFDLLLSQSMKFPQQRTLVFPDLLEEVAYTPFEPLADGKWFWKVRFHYNNLQTGVTGNGESEPAFVVIRSDGKDYRAPQITSFGPTRIETPTGAEIRVSFEDNPQGSGIDPSRVVLKIDGEDVTPQAQVSETGVVYRPARLEEAVHVGEVSIADRAGNEAAKKWWFIVKPKPREGIVTWDSEQKIFLVDGKPFFPFGMYQFRQADPNPYFEYRSWGFNTTQFYDGQPIPGVEQAGAAGVKCFAVHPFHGGTENEWNLRNENIPFEDPTVAPPIAQRIFDGCNLPGLFCWSICDEPDKGPLSRKRLRQQHEFIKSLDPYHLTDVILMQYGAYYAYADVADLIVGDVYPYDQWKGGHRPEMIWDEPIHQDRAQGGGKPVLTILQHAGGTPGTVLPHVVPTHHRRFMAYLVYVHGTRGIMWYAYSSGGAKYDAEKHPEQWESMKMLAKEFETMSPVLLSPDAPEQVAMQVVAPRNLQDSAGNPAIHYLMKTHDGKRYLIAVNATKEPVQAAFRIAAAVESVREIPDGRTIDLAGRGMFADTFTDYGVHVYEIALRGGSREESTTTDPKEDADQPSPQGKQVRTWTDATGHFRIEASLVRHADDMVHLRTPDGRIVRVPVEKLSSGDREYLDAEHRP